MTCQAPWLVVILSCGTTEARVSIFVPHAPSESESTIRPFSDEGGQLPWATEYFGAEMVIYSFQLLNIQEKAEDPGVKPTPGAPGHPPLRR